MAQAPKCDKKYYGPTTYTDISNKNIGEAGTSETDNIGETEIDLGETHVINKTVKGDLLKNIKFVDFNVSKKVIDSGTVSKMKVSK